MSERIETRRLRLYGHILRLPEETPVRQALAESDRKHKMPRGKPKLTWTRQISNNLKERGITTDQAVDLAQNRKTWHTIVARG